MLKTNSSIYWCNCFSKSWRSLWSAEIRDLSSWLISIGSNLQIQPIIEHPKSLQIADRLMEHSTVKHVVFGIHDFQKQWLIKSPSRIGLMNWNFLLICLTMEARIKGKVIGGVEVMLTPTHYLILCWEKDIRRWLDLHGDDASRHVYLMLKRKCNGINRKTSYYSKSY